MVERLSKIYSYFDLLVEKYDLEKIRHIGNNYMVAADVPRKCRDHAQSLARMALDIVDYTSGNTGDSMAIKFRIGKNSGPVVGGVIGSKQFSFDIWGDVVNTACRMESHGQPGRIHVTDSTYQLLKDHFVLQHRGNLNVKGIGEMNTWFLLHKRS